MRQIELNNYRTMSGNTTSRVFTGRERGAEVRVQSGIDNLFSESEPLKVVIPDDVFSITPSFLEELFKNIVMRYGKETVLKNVKFTGKYRIRNAFDEAVNRIAQNQENGI
ncbi:MAG: STAS-like domain-containing protein [Muribaculaceae bacterium]|nr:STAS-like domain-containing protein [Muribaculaceae bacterium]